MPGVQYGGHISSIGGREDARGGVAEQNRRGAGYKAVTGPRSDPAHVPRRVLVARFPEPHTAHNGQLVGSGGVLALRIGDFAHVR